MKFFTSLIAAGVILFIGCKSVSSDQKYVPLPPDTIKTPILYIAGKEGIRLDVAIRIGIDSMMFVDKDSLTKVKIKSRYFQYFLPLTDTVRGKDGKVLPPDSTGKYQFRTQYYPFWPGNIVRDMNINIDSVIKNFKPKMN